MIAYTQASTPVTRDILKTTRGKRTPFFEQAIEICKSIKKLQIFLYDVRKDYLDMSRYASDPQDFTRCMLPCNRTNLATAGRPQAPAAG
jgi:hypothetical protein